MKDNNSSKEFKFFDLLEDTVFELQNYFEIFFKTCYLLAFRKKIFADILLSDDHIRLCSANVFLFSTTCLLYISVGTVLTSQIKIERGEASWLENIASESQASFSDALIFSIIPIMILVISQGRFLGMFFKEPSFRTYIQQSFVYATGFSFFILAVPGALLGYYSLNIFNPLSEGYLSLLIMGLWPIVFLYVFLYPGILISTLLKERLLENNDIDKSNKKYIFLLIFVFIIFSTISGLFIINASLKTSDQLSINVTEIYLASDNEIEIAMVLKNNNRTTVVERSKGFEVAFSDKQSDEKYYSESFYKLTFTESVDTDFIILKPKDEIVLRARINKENIGRIHETFNTHLNLTDEQKSLYWPQSNEGLHNVDIDLFVKRGATFFDRVLKNYLSSYRVPLQRASFFDNSR